MTMKTKLFTISIFAATLVTFGIAAVAQKSQQNLLGQATQNQSQPGMMSGGMMGQGEGQGEGQGQGMMGGGMMGMMGQMTTHHQQMSSLMNKMMANMTAIQNEKGPATLKSKLAEQQSMLNEMHNQMSQQGKMMQMMSGQMKTECPAGGAVSNPPSK
jgi:hypothetical protein